MLTYIRVCAIIGTTNHGGIEMNSKKIVREVMKLRGHTYESLANKLGYEKPNRVSERLRGTTEMRVDTLVKLLSEMDCELVIKSNLHDKSEWTVSIETNDFLAGIDHVSKKRWICGGKSWVNWFLCPPEPCIYKYKNTCIFDMKGYNGTWIKCKGV